MTQTFPSSAPAELSAQPERQSWLGKLTRVTTSGRFIPEIDGLRFFAIMSVLIVHDAANVRAPRLIPVGSPTLGDSISQWLIRVAEQGPFGVQLFFVISGFILGLPFAEAAFSSTKRPGLGKYLLRRVTRLEPPYILSLLLAFAFNAIMVSRGYVHNITPWRDQVPHLAASLLYVHNLVYGQVSSVNGVAWSLEVEIQFYLLVPLLGLVFGIRNPAVRRAILILPIIAMGVLLDRYSRPDETSRLRMSILGQGHYFLAGLLFADIYLCRIKGIASRHLAWDFSIIAGVALLMATLLCGWPRFYLPLLVVFLYAAVFLAPVCNRIVRHPALYIIGGMCYTIYLYHGLMVGSLAQVTHRLYVSSLPYWVNYPMQLALHLCVILPVCGVLFVLVERPCMDRRWPAKLMARLRGRPAPALKGQ